MVSGLQDAQYQFIQKEESKINKSRLSKMEG